MKLREALSHQPVELAFGTSGLRALASDMTDLECYINTSGFLHFLEAKDGLKKEETVYIAGDLRDSTPRIMAAVAAAITDAGYSVINCGKIPVPALAYYALEHHAPCIMVSGSHIPADRNGIKFYEREGEVLKEDEAPIREAVSAVRQGLYDQEAATAAFDGKGNLKVPPSLGAVEARAEAMYIKRYTNVFDAQSLADKKIIVYQQSAVGRDVLVTILKALGAEAVPIERFDTFIPIDTENVTEVEKARFKSFSQQYPDAFAIISADGDSDRPFVIDETGEFHRGDVLGAIVAGFLGAKSAAVPISANDAINEYCQAHGIKLTNTKVGSPYVIAAMLAVDSAHKPNVSWEVNGGFLMGCDIALNGKALKALPTRDAALPIICSLLAAQRQQCSISELFASLPRRFTGGGLIDGIPETQIQKFRTLYSDAAIMKRLADQVFGGSDLGTVAKLDLTDGLRLIFQSGDVVHLRPSSNAPQFRVYSNASSQSRADQLATNALAPDGYIIRLLDALDALPE
jgi:phosphomannomutase